MSSVSTISPTFAPGDERYPYGQPGASFSDSHHGSESRTSARSTYPHTHAEDGPYLGLDTTWYSATESRHAALRGADGFDAATMLMQPMQPYPPEPPSATTDSLSPRSDGTHHSWPGSDGSHHSWTDLVQDDVLPNHDGIVRARRDGSYDPYSPIDQRRSADDFDAAMLLVPPMLPRPSNGLQSDSKSWPDFAQQRSNSKSDQAEGSLATRPRKSRREKPRIALAPDQPMTTQGKPRARVFVACLQCRNRKIRCDGAKPVCFNCKNRTNSTDECNFDVAPKRRGPDRNPGARQRISKEQREAEGGAKRRRRRRPEAETASHANGASKGEGSKAQRSAAAPPTLAIPPADGSTTDEPVSAVTQSDFSSIGFSPVSVVGDGFYPELQVGPFSPRNLSAENLLSQAYTNGLDAGTDPYGTRGGFLEPVNEDEYGDRHEDNVTTITAGPSMEFTRKTWYESLLSLYTNPFAAHRPALTPSQRSAAARGVSDELRFIFRSSNYWFAFINVPSFLSTYADPSRRANMQPSLVLAMLACAASLRASDMEDGAGGRARALRLRDSAQSALDASVSAGWIDETLAQAAWLLAFFECCAHPMHTAARARSAMALLDAIIRSLGLTMLDAGDSRVSSFPPGTVPAIGDAHALTRAHTHSSNTWPDVGCACRSLSLGAQWEGAGEHAPLWLSTPAWEEADLKREACRRLCWSTMMLAAGLSSFMAAWKSDGLDLFVADPANFALLFPGEALAQAAGQDSKSSIWALYYRTMLLWHSCLRARLDERAENKAQFAVSAWLEADALDAALDRHTCDMERAFLWQGREYLFNVRMLISNEFQRFVPAVDADMGSLFNRRKAEEWLRMQAAVTKRLMQGLNIVTGQASNILARRPFFVFWFMGQISRALTLWSRDNSLTLALDVCKDFLAPVEYLSAIWPCPEQRQRYEQLRGRLDAACYVSGIDPPPPADFSTIPRMV